MMQLRPPSPVRGALFYTASTLLLMTVGFALQRSLGSLGIALNQMLLFLGLALAFGFAADGRPVREVFRLRPLTVSGLGKSLALGLVAWGFVQMFGSLLLKLVALAGGTMPPLYQDLAQVGFVTALLTRAVLPAVCEEMAFRGYIQWSLGPLGRRAAVVGTALLFGMMHFSLIRLLPLALLGWIYAEAVQRSRSIVPGVLMHLINNTVALSLTYFASDSALGAGMGALGIPVLAVSAAVLGVAACGLARSFTPADSGAEPEEESAPVADRLGFLVPLAPALVLFAYAAWSEMAVVFGV